MVMTISSVGSIQDLRPKNIVILHGGRTVYLHDNGKYLHWSWSGQDSLEAEERLGPAIARFAPAEKGWFDPLEPEIRITLKELEKLLQTRTLCLLGMGCQKVGHQL